MSEEARKREDDYYAGTMKDDYISRKAVLNKLNEECGSCADTGYIFSLPGIEKQPGITLESAIDYLHSTGWMQEHDRTLTESAQPERKKGKWIQIIKGEHGYSAGDFRCSVCEQPNPCHHLTKFCPNCGARMEGIDETD